ncbi:MAG: hypothetical protein ACM31I_08865, partial [Deltaproteobacteria bacterium]
PVTTANANATKNASFFILSSIGFGDAAGLAASRGLPPRTGESAPGDHASLIQISGNRTNRRAVPNGLQRRPRKKSFPL